ncbi:peptide/nickel transport system substrate-binding protein [Sesbania bispinosa]|nr:peptide/nickel transport system substrate-binding protein [Sesbania bispinosa]
MTQISVYKACDTCRAGYRQLVTQGWVHTSPLETEGTARIKRLAFYSLTQRNRYRNCAGSSPAHKPAKPIAPSTFSDQSLP